MDTQKDTLILGYWPIRGLAQPIRNLMEYLEVQYEEKPTQDRDDWLLREKPELFKLNPFITLPHLIDQEKVITESEAILTYLALKYKPELLGATHEQKVELATVAGCAKDLNTSLVRHYYDVEGIEKNKEKVVNDQVVPQLQKLETHIGQTKAYMCKDLTVVDFKLTETLDALNIYDPTILKGFPNLLRYLTSFRAIPQLKAYFGSERYKERPINGYIAGFK